MAQAEKKIVKKEVVTVVDEEHIVLTLNPAQAQTLLDIMGMIGGSPYTTRRAHTDAIYKALRDAGVTQSRRRGGKTRAFDPMDVSPTQNSIYFMDTP